jgi:hypothetical protein
LDIWQKMDTSVTSAAPLSRITAFRCTSTTTAKTHPAVIQ